jgi:ATP-dependent Clp protease adaptor protein ClpS
MRVMMTAHRRGACVVAVYTKDVAEAKATNATDAGRRKGYPLLFTTEPELSNVGRYMPMPPPEPPPPPPSLPPIGCTYGLLCCAGPFAAAQPADTRITMTSTDRKAVNIASVSAATSAAATSARRVHEDRRGLSLLRPGIGRVWRCAGGQDQYAARGQDHAP